MSDKTLGQIAFEAHEKWWSCEGAWGDQEKYEQEGWEAAAEAAVKAFVARCAAAELTKMADDDGIPCDFALINEDGVAKWKKE